MLTVNNGLEGAPSSGWQAFDELVLDQWLAKFHRKKRLTKKDDEKMEAFKTLTGGLGLAELVERLKQRDATAAAWLKEHEGLSSFMDRLGGGGGYPILISDAPDVVREVQQGWGETGRPLDYLKGFPAKPQPIRLPISLQFVFGKSLAGLGVTGSLLV